jgi:hypothetical protein
MASIIKIPFKSDINEIYKYGVNQSKPYKGFFSGDTSSGLFDFESVIGKFKGKYVVKNNIIEIVFEKKPFFIPNNVIENFLKSHIK